MNSQSSALGRTRSSNAFKLCRAFDLGLSEISGLREWARHSIGLGINSVGLTRSATAERQGGQVFSRSPNCARMGRLFAAYSIGQRSSS
ncbi:hypothetical protein ELH38_29605 (plasmid) [Rhizobium ruizarguesonis]|nr:hypothetical protein ELH38_29605 [Rhizobium ruizarguesonis]